MGVAEANCPKLQEIKNLKYILIWAYFFDRVGGMVLTLLNGSKLELKPKQVLMDPQAGVYYQVYEHKGRLKVWSYFDFKLYAPRGLSRRLMLVKNRGPISELYIHNKIYAKPRKHSDSVELDEHTKQVYLENIQRKVEKSKQIQIVKESFRKRRTKG